MMKENKLLEPNSQWIPLIQRYEIPHNGGLLIPVAGRWILASRFQDQVNCFVSECPHLSRSLEWGRIQDGKITCPFHHYQFSLQDGRCLTALCDPLTPYPVKVEGEQVFIALNS